jgi:hypothetical protein
MRCDGSETTYRTSDNGRLVEHEHPPETARQHTRSYRVPDLEPAGPLANGSGEVPLQVELKTLQGGNVWDYFKPAGSAPKVRKIPKIPHSSG